jgi:hypothetical protein
LFEALIDPTAGALPGSGGTALAHRHADLRGRTVGLLANTKRNAGEFLDAVADLLAAEHGAADVVRRRKLSITDPVPAGTLAELVESCDVVVVGVGDCGSCSASAVADGLALEAAGIPAVVICSDAFTVSADAMARLQGSPGYGYVTTAHPVAPLDADGVRERARLALPEIVGTLTAPRTAAA